MSNILNKISFIVAMSENRVIGVENRLPWNIPADLKRFKQVTSGHSIIMGRKTYDSIGRILPNRTNIIVTRNPYYKLDGALVAHSLDEAIIMAQSAPGNDEIFVIGGGELFNQGMHLANKIYLTLIHTKIRGDAFFPVYDEMAFVKTAEEHFDAVPAYTFLTLEKMKKHN